jgi:photosystem II stability/assembly factor-like uncharacterized protein
VVSQFSLFAGKEKMNARLKAANFVVGQSVAVTDNKFPNVTIGGTAVIKSSVARITLGLDNTILNLNYLGNANTYLKVGVKITTSNASGVLTSQVKEITLNHNATGLTTNRSNVIVKNAHSVIARILYFKNSSNVIVASPLIPSNIFLDTEIETERYYPLNVTTLVAPNHFYNASTNELEVYWNNITGAEEYELEYTYVNNIDASSQSYTYTPTTANPNAFLPAIINNIAATSLAFTFNNNATRIRTSKNNFKISLNYNRGLIVYRVRTVGKLISNTNLEVFGNWTLNQPQTQLSLTLPSGFNDFYVIPTGHEENKNWQATTTFAEEGKKKDVIGYFDGSNHKRQTVTRSNTENVSLVGETMYDSQGRPAITVLPSPASNYSSKLNFFENFNQSATQPLVAGLHIPYSRLDFETTNTLTCPVPAGAMYTGAPATNANGASVYYSNNNQNLQNQNAYIPDAKQYPFTHNVYAPDNTGKVKYQSGVGDNHKISSGHETKNVEGDPDQEDLDKLFGSEAGYAEKYKKNMTIDANGQISVSYLNTEGKVVATALAGNPPTNVNALSNLNVYPKSSKYMDYSSGNYTSVNLAANGALTFNKKILPDITGTYNFFYDITVPQYTDPCISNFCYDCAYDLEIKIVDECGAVVYSKTATVGQPINYTCGTPIYFSSTGFTPAFNALLTAGKEYNLSKVLTINNTAMNQYLNHYIDTLNNTCIKKPSYFNSLAFADVDFSGCNMSCAACSTKVEQYYVLHNNINATIVGNPAYDPNYIYMSPAQRQQAIDKCLKPCKPASLCETEFETMLQDMRPMGQYAQYTVTGTTYNASIFDLSIFNSLNHLRISTIYGGPTATNGTPFVPYDISKQSFWRNPEYYNVNTHNFSSPDVAVPTAFHYFDANGNISKIRLVQLPGGAYYPNVVSNTPLTNSIVPSTGALGVYTDNIGPWTYPANLADLKDFISAYSNNQSWAYSLVKNHPEFNYFLDCDRQSNPAYSNSVPGRPVNYTSEQFDIDLRLANTLAEANGATGINVGNSKWGNVSSNGNAINDLINDDPYFNVNGAGASLKSTFSARLSNYQGSGITIKQICAQMYSSGQMYYAPSSCTAAVLFGGTSLVCNSVTYIIPTAALDEMWKSYREMYITEKQRFITEQSHQAACNPGGGSLPKNNYFNGAIGDQNFTPFPSYANYGFYPFLIPIGGAGLFPFSAISTLLSIIVSTPSFWPNYPAGTSGISQPLFHPNFGKGYFDYGSPSAFYHKARYANKVRRVPDTQTLANAFAGGATDPNDIMTNLNNTAEAEIYAQTGQCPIYKRLELFLSTIAKKGTLFNSSVITPLVSEPAFTKQVYDAIISCGGLTPATWIPLGFKPILTPNSITIKFYNMIPTVPTVILGADIVLNSSATISNWSFVKAFKDIQFNGTTGSNNTFNIKALYQPTGSPYSVLNFSGTTCIQSNCPQLASAASGQICTPTQQAFELQSFLSAVVSDYSAGVATPLNLGNASLNNSANFFTTLVRYPFTTALVSSGSHIATLTNLPTSSTISIQGPDALPQNITVNFAFTPSVATGPQNLTNALYFGNFQLNQTSSTTYDFTIKAYYAAGVTQLFKVKINYPANLCGNLITNTCRLYNLKSCQQIVTGSCANNNNYKTSVQLQALLNEIVTYPLNSTIPATSLTNFSTLLQSQYGGVSSFLQSLSSQTTTTPGLTNFNLYIASNGGYLGHCMIQLACTSSVALSSFNPNLFVFSNLSAINGPSSQFTIAATDGVNTYTFTGNVPCLTLDNCEGCNLDVTLYSQNFEAYNGQTTTAALNFATEKFDAVFNSIATPCNFVGTTCFSSASSYSNYCSPVQSPSVFGDVAIRTNAGCSISPYTNNTPTGTKYLNVFVNNPQSYTSGLLQSAYIIPWTTISPLTVVPGKKYEISYYFRPGICEHYYRVETIANNGTSDYVINTVTVTTQNSTYSSYSTQWNLIKSTFAANSTSVKFKIKVSPIIRTATNNYGQMGEFSLDDITIKELNCQKETGVPIVDDTPAEDDCLAQLANIALANAQQQYNLYINNVKNDFIEAYTKKCYQSLERLQATYQSREGHYTLYYYDQGGNLIKTIPPEGIEQINLAAIEPISGLTYAVKIANDRDNKTKTVFTNHRMATRYEYNSLNQLIKQQMPDHANVDLYSTTNLTSLPSGFNVTAMDFSNSNQGYLIGSSGAGTSIYITNNGGSTWAQATGLTTANIVDIDYAGTTAYAIVSDGTIFKSTNYNTATPTWLSLILPSSSTMQFTDIEFYSATNGYITGKNGLLLNTTDGGLTWSTINLGTLNDFNKIDFKNDGFGVYGVLGGNNGTVFYITPANLAANLWTPFPSLNTAIDVLNTSIAETGNGLITFLNVFISGVDKSILPNSGTVINITNMNGPSPTINNLYLTGSSTFSSKIPALATNTYGAGVIDIFFGGSLNNGATTILYKLQSTTPGVFTGLTPISTSGISINATTINDLVVRGVGNSSYNMLGVTQSGKYFNINPTANSAVCSNLNTTGSNINTAPCNRVNIDPSNNQLGLVAGNLGTIIRYDNTSGLTSQSQTAFSILATLNAITAAKDGSGYVYAVGNSGAMVRSTNFGASWQLMPTGLASTINLMAAKYVTTTPPQVIIAGNAYAGKINPATNVITPLSGLANNYKSIDTPTGNSNLVFLAGSNISNTSRIIDNYTLSPGAGLANPITPYSSSGTSLNKIAFYNTGLAFAVGNGGFIVKSTNNGVSFSSVASGTNTNFTDVVIQDQFTAFAFGGSPSTIRKTTDAGITWTTKTAPAGTNITSVVSFGNGNILAAGSGITNLFKINDQSGDYSSRFFYDALGRLIISQNAKQYNKANKAYSYTIYDAIGRITQVGEIAGAALTDPYVLSGNVNGIIPIAAYTTWLTTGTKTEVTSTVYDNAVTIPCGSAFTQANLRKRVSATFIDTDANLTNGYTHATYYSYDIHGNVKSLIQENRSMPSGQTCKKIDYEYDLISGKVNQVAYQANQPDAFYHKYDYDADNRITNVFTSKDAIDWQQDAKYFYYLHGPLARVEIGNDKVQGMDYAYTIQGWIKGVNSVAVNINNDIGKDGKAGTAYNSALADLNKYISYDAAGYALHYFGYTAGSFVNDYQAIDPAKNTNANRFDGNVSSNTYFTLNNSLYNGNIMAMATSIYTQQPLVVAATAKPQLATYKYDQLNRINQLIPN